MSSSNDVIQYYTNNDGSLEQVLNNPNAPPALRQAAADKLGVEVPGSSGSAGGDTSGSGSEANQAAPLHTYLSVRGTYYRSAYPRNPGDSLVVTASPQLEELLDAAGEMNVNTVHDMMQQQASAAAGSGM